MLGYKQGRLPLILLRIPNSLVQVWDRKFDADGNDLGEIEIFLEPPPPPSSSGGGKTHPSTSTSGSSTISSSSTSSANDNKANEDDDDGAWRFWPNTRRELWDKTILVTNDARGAPIQYKLTPINHTKPRGEFIHRLKSQVLGQYFCLQYQVKRYECCQYYGSWE